MSSIKSLADELRETIKQDVKAKPNPTNITTPDVGKGSGKKSQKNEGPALEKLFENILAFELNGKEKLLIRLNDKTIFLLKQLKIAKSIDMNKLIAYCVQDFLNRHPELIQYVKQNIKTIEL
jgi:hypothetical protein